MKKRRRKNKLVVILAVLLVLVLGALSYLLFFMNDGKVTETVYLASDSPEVTVLDKDLNETVLVRGTEAGKTNRKKKVDDTEYVKIIIGEDEYYCSEEYLKENREDTVLEDALWVYRTCTVYESESGSDINGLSLKGTKIDITGHTAVNEDGTVDRYQFADGYILNKYLTADENYATAPDDSSYARAMAQDTEDSYGAGSASTLDYYPNEKASFEDNVMPEVCKALYINASALYDIEDYIDYALTTNINTFVIDIRDSHIVSYASPVMEKYSPTSFEAAYFSKDSFKEKVAKVKAAGLYTVARITVFKDSNFMTDHPEYAILDKNDNMQPFRYGGAYWPSAYCREVWEYNVELSKECITDIGFNEVQYDYVRFPEQIDYFADVLDALDLQNEYNETRAQAIQRFLMYACDEVHAVGGYMSADVFGETSEGYVCAYGQYLPAISNVVDVISPMPYPDHFGPHAYGIEEIVWEVPYKLLMIWGEHTKRAQSLIPTPAKVRTYIQGYNSIYEPIVFYDNEKVDEQIRALIDSGIYDGYIVWNSGSFIDTYQLFKEAL
ncbi:MAG: hypothetical protein IKF68_00740, partial [Erysipelotrichaceae bacterium]|nr:hypothetical protein [Erysipelotrichaceae bacterium]